MDAKGYLASSVLARPVYLTLWDAALSVLPPTIEGDNNVECYYTARDLSKQLGTMTPSVVQNYLRWLVNWGWITNRKGSWRYLGRRCAGTWFLLADLAAKNATGEERLVSREVLGVTLEAPPVTEFTVKRRAAREWTGDKTVRGGGRLDLGV